MNETKYVIGMDLGTDSARAILLGASGKDKGREISVCTCEYKRWKKGMFCNPSENMFRQHPQDYIEAVENVLLGVIKECPDKESILAISVDTTASTPCLTDENMVPLSMYEEFSDNPDAMFVLWKDHSAEKEASEIESLINETGQKYACHNGNNYSPENFWSKILHLMRKSGKVRDKAVSAIELCDFIPSVLTGCRSAENLKMSHCVASAKCMWDEQWGGYPPAGFLKKLDFRLAEIRENLPQKNYFCSESAGTLCKEWAEKLGLSEKVLVGVGNVDSHSGAIGGGIEYRKMILSFGTSAGFMCVVPNDIMNGRTVEGVFGQADGIILPGHNGFEVGLSCYGDIFAWFRNMLSWTADKFLPENQAEEIKDRILYELNAEASQIKPSIDAPLATDHFNGRRCPFVNSSLSASLSNLRLSSTVAELFYALVESTAFATKAILDNMKENNVEIDSLVAVGGVAQKSPFAMQMIADVTGCNLNVSATKNAGALGAAMHASVVAGIFPDVPTAQRELGAGILKTYVPDRSKSDIFISRYEKYKKTVRFNEENIL